MIQATRLRRQRQLSEEASFESRWKFRVTVSVPVTGSLRGWSRLLDSTPDSDRDRLLPRRSPWP